MSKRVICKNEFGQELEISYKHPFFLLDAEGVYEIHHTVTTVKDYNMDGERRTGSTAEMRNIVLTVQIKEDYELRRDELYNFFQPSSTGTLYYYEKDIARKIDYEVESIAHPHSGGVRVSSISLLCPNPLFRDIKEKRESMAMWQGNIVFPLNIENPFSVAEKVNSLIRNIYNNTNAVLGMRIRFSATGEVHNPQLLDVTRNRLLKIDLVMHANDTLVIETAPNRKTAVFTSNGVSTNVINKIAYPPKWPMLYHGDNVFRYDADDDTIDVLNVDIFWDKTYWGC